MVGVLFFFEMNFIWEHVVENNDHFQPFGIGCLEFQVYIHMCSIYINMYACMYDSWGSIHWRVEVATRHCIIYIYMQIYERS